MKKKRPDGEKPQGEPHIILQGVAIRQATWERLQRAVAQTGRTSGVWVDLAVNEYLERSGY